MSVCGLLHVSIRCRAITSSFSRFQSSTDLACFVHFEKVNIYSTSNYKQKYRAPTDFCFMLKVSSAALSGNANKKKTNTLCNFPVSARLFLFIGWNCNCNTLNNRTAVNITRWAAWDFFFVKWHWGASVLTSSSGGMCFKNSEGFLNIYKVKKTQSKLEEDAADLRFGVYRVFKFRPGAGLNTEWNNVQTWAGAIWRPCRLVVPQCYSAVHLDSYWLLQYGTALTCFRSHTNSNDHC